MWSRAGDTPDHALRRLRARRPTYPPWHLTIFGCRPSGRRSRL